MNMTFIYHNLTDKSLYDIKIITTIYPVTGTKYLEQKTVTIKLQNQPSELNHEPRATDVQNAILIGTQSFPGTEISITLNNEGINTTDAEEQYFEYD